MRDYQICYDMGAARAISERSLEALVNLREGDAALVFLYLLRNGGKLEPEQAEIDLGMDSDRLERALAQLKVRPDHVLIDGNRAKDFGLPVTTVVKGDSLSANIAAASILAKVTRDELMENMAVEYPQYQFEIHKGYGTKAHYAALTEYGPSPIHRMTFLKKFYGQK